MALAVAAIGLAVGAPSAGAEVAVDDPDFADISGFLSDLGFGEEAIAEVAKATNKDRLEDLVNPVGQPPPTYVGGADIAAGSFFEVRTTQQIAESWFAPGGPLAEGSDGVARPVMPAGQPIPDEFYVYAVVMAERPAGRPSGRIEAGVTAFDETPSGGEPGIPWENAAFPGDWFSGQNVAWSTRSDNGAPFRVNKLVYPGTGQFTDTVTDTVSVIRGRTILSFVPRPEWDGIASGRVFGFGAGDDEIAIDTFPDLTEPAMPYAGITELELGLAPEPTPSALDSAAPTIVQPVPADPSPAASASPASGPTSTAADFPWLVAVGGGIALILGGLYLLIPRRGVARVTGELPGGGVVASGGAAEVSHVAVDSDGPCAPLVRAAAEAATACDEALAAARAAREGAEVRRTEAEARRQAAEAATRRREQAEAELARARQLPPTVDDWVESEIGGRRLRIDEYDRELRDRAFDEANKDHHAALEASTTDAERAKAHEELQRRNSEIADPGSIRGLREIDRIEREGQIQQADVELERARSSEELAKAELVRAEPAVEAAGDEATRADLRAEEICAAASVARTTADDCIGAIQSGTECVDGAEEWRREGSSATFIVPQSGGKITIEAQPALAAVDEWQDQWSTTGGDGKPIAGGGTQHGIPPMLFRRTDDARLDRIFDAVGRRAGSQTIAITMPLVEIAVHCERRYVCVDGRWVGQEDRRAMESDPVPKPQTPDPLSGDALTRNQAVVYARQAILRWQKAEQDDLERRSLGSRCGS